MILHTARGEYRLQYDRYGVIIVSEPYFKRLKRFLGLKSKRFWKEVYKKETQLRGSEMERFHPEKLLRHFTEALQEYEEYAMKWKAFHDIQRSGAKLEVKLPENVTLSLNHAENEVKHV